MKVSGLDNDNDWRFGKSLAQYKRDSLAVYQNIQTRIKFFTDDWFLDVEEGIDWFALLGNKNTQTQILREIERVVLTTENVRSITKLEIKDLKDREAVIELAITTLYDDVISDQVSISI